VKSNCGFDLLDMSTEHAIMASHRSDVVLSGTATMRLPNASAPRVRDEVRELAFAAYGVVSPRTILKTIFSSDALAILVTWRLRMLGRRYHIPGLNHVFHRVQMFTWGIELGKDATLGRGVYFVHPVGVVIGGTSHIGDRVKFLGSNTIGTAKDDGYPIIEEDVTIGAGARILGPVRVGARSVIGANAVVVRDVPHDSVAAGVPARLLRERRGRSDPAGVLR
jgi:serine O-acetyltransferase